MGEHIGSCTRWNIFLLGFYWLCSGGVVYYGRDEKLFIMFTGFTIFMHMAPMLVFFILVFYMIFLFSLPQF
jgi:hypothetical protein